MDYNKLIKKKNIDSSLKFILENPLKNIPTIKEAIEISKKYGVDLHPRYLLYFNELNVSELILFLEFLESNIEIKGNDTLILPNNNFKRYFELLALEHKIKDKEYLEINEESKNILLINLGIDITDKYDEKKIKYQIRKIIDYAKKNLDKTSVEIVNDVNFIGVKDKGGSYIGARMGRPEKAKMRKQFNDDTKSVALFPVGTLDRRGKNIVQVLKDNDFIEEEFRIFYCEKCKEESIFPFCLHCRNDNLVQLCFEKYTTNVYDKNRIKKILESFKTSEIEYISKKIKNFIEIIDDRFEQTNFVDIKFIEDLKDFFINLLENIERDKYNNLIDRKSVV